MGQYQQHRKISISNLSPLTPFFALEWTNRYNNDMGEKQM